jgi:hypothetical protein
VVDQPKLSRLRLFGTIAERDREREREEKWNRQRLSEIDVHDGQVLTSSKSFSILFLFFQNPWPWLRQSLYTARICSRSCASSTQ